MKAAICCINAKYIHVSPAPWCLKAGADAFCKNDIITEVKETTINADTDAFISMLSEGYYDFISFTCYIWNITQTLTICKKLKSNINTIIALGGPEVSYRAKNVLKDYPFIDFVLSGEGENTYPLLLDTIYEKGDLNLVPGLTYRKKNEIISNAEAKYEGTPPSPYTEKFLNNLNGRISYIETSRGCPYRCAFCLSGRCSDLRFFNIEQVKDDIIKLASSGTKTVKFVDRTFNSDKKRSKEILRFILDNYGKDIPEGVCFHFEIAGDILDEETLNILKNAPYGSIQLEIGMQSFNPKTLEAINRKTDLKRLTDNIKTLVSFGNMHIHIDLIAGLTYEDFETFRESFNTGYSLKANMLQMGFLKLLHGADMREHPDKYPCKFNPEPPYEVTETPWLTTEEIISLKNCEDALERLYNSGRFLFTLDYLIDECGFEPFKVFFNFGNMINGSKMNLSDYALHLFNYFKEFKEVNENTLHEYIFCDLLSCSSALQIPKEFKIKDSLYKRAKKYFTNNKSEMIKVAFQHTRNKIFVVNQSGKKDLSGRFPYTFYDMDIIKYFTD